MENSTKAKFQIYYEQHCKHLKLKGLQPKTIEAYSRAIRRIGDYFNYRIDDLTQEQLLDYFHQLTCIIHKKSCFLSQDFVLYLFRPIHKHRPSLRKQL